MNKVTETREMKLINLRHDIRAWLKDFNSAYGGDEMDTMGTFEGDAAQLLIRAKELLK